MIEIIFLTNRKASCFWLCDQGTYDFESLYMYMGIDNEDEVLCKE